MVNGVNILKKKRVNFKIKQQKLRIVCAQDGNMLIHFVFNLCNKCSSDVYEMVNDFFRKKIYFAKVS